MEKENTQNLAERIAALLRENENTDADFFRSSLEKINQRLEQIESRISAQNINPQSAIRNSHLPHPSQEKFEILEAFAAAGDGHFEDEKPCPFEPTGKPCDHCSMCNSRGF